jgi:hypothetical protein
MGQTRFEWPADEETEPVRPARQHPVAAKASLTLLPAPTAQPSQVETSPLPPGLADELGRIFGEALVAQFRADAIRKSVSRPGLHHRHPLDPAHPLDAGE